MSNFEDLIKEKPISSIHLQRKTALVTVENKVQKIKELDPDNPNPRIFTRIEQEANDALQILEKANSALVTSLMKVNPNINLEESFQKDQKDVRGEEFICINAIEGYIKHFADKGIMYPLDSKPDSTPSDLASILKQTTQMTNKCWNENVEKIIKTNSSAAPKPTQPHFTSKQTDADYGAFSDFWSRFQHFTKKCVGKSDKLEWLKSSVKGEAHLLIKNLSLEDSNYDTAVTRLHNKYLNPASVKHSLLQSVLNFKCESGVRYTKAESAITALANDLDELKNVHKLDIGVELCKELLREIIFYRLPADVRIGLIDACKTNYPSFSNIMSKFQEVVTKLNIGNDFMNGKQNNPQTPKSGKPDSGNQNEKTTFSLNAVQHNRNQQSKNLNRNQNQKFNHAKSDRKCVFCGSADHSSSKCIKVTSKEERVNILKRDRKDNCSKCWARQHPGQVCPQLFCCTDTSCIGTHGVHAKLLCPKTIGELLLPKTIGQVNTIPLPNSVNNVARYDQKAVALPTAVMIAHNPAALKLPLEQRNVSLLADSGGQRTLITREAANRLGLDIVGIERACLQGYGAKSGSNSRFDVVNVRIGRVTETHPISFDVFVVPNLNPLHMTGAAKFVEKLVLKVLIFHL